MKSVMLLLLDGQPTLRVNVEGTAFDHVLTNEQLALLLRQGFDIFLQLTSKKVIK